MSKTIPVYYNVHVTSEVNVFRVNKLSEDLDPLSSYVVNIARRTCTCPSYKQPCKHQKIVKRYVDNGCPTGVYFNPVSDEFEEALGIISNE